MQLQIFLLLSLYLPIKTQNLTEKTHFIIQLRNLTETESNSSYCATTNDCQKHMRCMENQCQCQKGWINWHKDAPCSYQQISKLSTFFYSLFFGYTGLDWFVLSRQNFLYVLTGLLKFLLTLASCIWARLVIINQTQTSMIVAGSVTISLAILTFIWWLIDWIRIVRNTFPDGNGVLLTF